MKKCIGLLLSLLLLLSLAACGGKDAWQEQYDLGLRYLSDGNYQEAVIAFLAAIEIDAKRPEAYLGAAEAYVALDEPEKAEDILRRGYEETEDEQLLDYLNQLTDNDDDNNESGEVYWASFIGRPLRDVCQYLGMTYTPVWVEGYAAYFSGFATVYCETSTRNLEPQEEDTVCIISVANGQPVIDGFVGGMTYPELTEALAGRVQLDAPQYDVNSIDDCHYWTSFDLDGYHISYSWQDDPDHTASAVTRISPLRDEVLISEDEALALVSDYWNYTPGDVAEENGFPLYIVSNGLEARLSGKNYYIFRMRWLVNNSHLSTIDFAMVDAKTGECLPTDLDYFSNEIQRELRGE